MNRLLSIIAVWSVTITYAQDALFCEVDKDMVGVNEQFTYTLISTKNCEITPPRFRGLQIVAGPIRGQSSQTSIINGVKTQSNEYTFTWYLRAKEVGVYTIESAEMQCKKESFSTDELKIKVISQEDMAAAREGIAEHYLTLSASKTEVFEGEPFILSLKFYSKKRPTDVENYVNGVSSGLERTDLRKPTDVYKIVQEDINGSRYYVIELRKELCIPLRSGDIEIEPSYGSMWFNQGVFDSYQQDGYSNSLIIHAKPIPEEQPDNYIGLVGDFEMDFEIDKQSLKANQALEMKMTLSGTGNFNSFDPPPINLPEGLELYSPDPEVEDTITATTEGLSGKRTYVYTILAKKKGDYEIQPFNFSYYDVRTNTFDSLYTENIDLEVNKGTKANVSRIKETVTVDTTDIRFIQTGDSNFFQEDEMIYGTFTYYITLASPIAIALLTISFMRRKANMSEEEKLALLQKSAKKSSLKTFDEAKSFMSAGEEKQALTALQSGMIGFFSTKLNMSMSEISKNTISEKLRSKAIDENTVNQFNDCWSKIEMAQYAPVSTDNINQLISETEQLINQVNSKI